jgi:hypothetical protein
MVVAYSPLTLRRCPLLLEYLEIERIGMVAALQFWANRQYTSWVERKLCKTARAFMAAAFTPRG